MDTIFALASGAPPCAVAVIRISGSKAVSVVENLSGRSFKARLATLARLGSVDGNKLIDRALVVVFPGPKSFTGDDVVELQVHGSRAVIRAVFDELSALGCRPARAGEFTRRAFLNGKLDLTSVEALGDLIDSETELQRRQAISGLSGLLFSTIGSWRDQLLQVLSTLEAMIDFVDEGDIPESIQERVASGLESLRAEMEDMLRASRQGQAIRDGLLVVILGPPNAGKSALMNAIAGREVAIVSARAGTTRDPIEVRVDLDGLPVTFVDTAGIRDAADEIEREGIRRARARSDNADLILWLSEDDEDSSADFGDKPMLRVRTKTDISPRGDSAFDHYISTRSGDGVGDLLVDIANVLRASNSGFEPSLITRARQKAQIERALAGVERASHADLDIELASEELRRAILELDGLVGAIDSEQVLDEIFRTFCLGK